LKEYAANDLDHVAGAVIATYAAGVVCENNTFCSKPVKLGIIHVPERVPLPEGQKRHDAFVFKHEHIEELSNLFPDIEKLAKRATADKVKRLLKAKSTMYAPLVVRALDDFLGDP
jgi:hypothetical protein